MVHKCPHLDSVHELRHAANVVAVIVRDEDIVDRLETGCLCPGNDAVGVATIEIRKSSVDQQRFTLRSDDQSSLSAFDVDEIDFEAPALLSEHGAGGERCEKEGNDKPSDHAKSLSKQRRCAPQHGRLSVQVTDVTFPIEI